MAAGFDGVRAKKPMEPKVIWLDLVCAHCVKVFHVRIGRLPCKVRCTQCGEINSLSVKVSS